MIRLKIKLLLIALLALFSAQAYTKNSDQITIFKNARIIDGSGNVIENGNLVIAGNKIKTVTSQTVTYLHATVIDATGKTIMPALIDAHMHLGLLRGTSIDYKNISEQNIRRQLKRYAQYGVGAVLSLGRDSDLIYKLRALRLKQELPGPYIYTAGKGFGVVNGAPPGGVERPDAKYVYRPTTAAEVVTDMKQLAAHRPNMVKLWVDDWLGKMPKMKPAIYDIVIDEAHKYDLPVAGHIYYLKDAKSLIRSGINVLEHSIRDNPVDADLINLMRQHHVAIVPTLTLTEAFFIYNDRPAWMFKPFFRNALEPGVFKTLMNRSYGVELSQRKTLVLILRNIKTLHDKGILIGLGTDSGALPTRVQGFADHRELQLFVAAGLTPMQALQIGTIQSAKIIGADKIMGSLEPGKLANFLVLNANPLDDISNTQRIAAVWLDGKLFRN